MTTARANPSAAVHSVEVWSVPREGETPRDHLVRIVQAGHEPAYSEEGKVQLDDDDRILVKLIKGQAYG